MLEIKMITPAERIKLMVEQLVKLAAADGFVVTVEQKPLQPPAMGNYETVVDVRPVRAKS